MDAVSDRKAIYRRIRDYFLQEPNKLIILKKIDLILQRKQNHWNH